VGNGINKLIERALPEEHRQEATVLRLREYFVPYYDAHNCDLTHPYDGIPELLQALKAAGHTLAVASNKYQAATEKIVAQLFPDTFDVVLGERDGIARKPDPQIVWDIVERTAHSAYSLELRGKGILYIGDSLVDAETAKAANLPFIACTWGFCTTEQLQTAAPDYMVHHPNEILKLV
jgi:phosphoglycolate phosphatase